MNAPAIVDALLEGKQLRLPIRGTKTKPPVPSIDTAEFEDWLWDRNGDDNSDIGAIANRLLALLKKGAKVSDLAKVMEDYLKEDSSGTYTTGAELGYLPFSGNKEFTGKNALLDIALGDPSDPGYWDYLAEMLMMAVCENNKAFAVEVAKRGATLERAMAVAGGLWNKEESARDVLVGWAQDSPEIIASLL